MKVAVYDTYVLRKDGEKMHFDILVPDGTEAEQAHTFGHAYLEEKGQGGQPLTAKECRFCHKEEAKPEVAKAIREKGYYIVEMEGCN